MTKNIQHHLPHHHIMVRTSTKASPFSLVPTFKGYVLMKKYIDSVCLAQRSCLSFRRGMLTPTYEYSKYAPTKLRKISSYGNKEMQKGLGAKSQTYEDGFPNIGGNARIFSHICREADTILNLRRQTTLCRIKYRKIEASWAVNTKGRGKGGGIS
jgi:hypothetical protein